MVGRAHPTGEVVSKSYMWAKTHKNFVGQGVVGWGGT
jgi:hypothetical protein